eukprot:s3710_g1.t3
MKDLVSSLRSRFAEPSQMNLKKLQAELYGVSTLEEALLREGQLKDEQPKAGVCPNQWRSQEIAFRCLDCELDNNCVQCSDCFFKAKHEGHEVQMIRTVGGSCDCGDPASWDPQGFCPEHCETPARLDSAEALELLPPVILMGARRLLPQLLEQVDTCVKKSDETRSEQVIEILELLQRFGEAHLQQMKSELIGLRFLVQEQLQGDRINLWMTPPAKLAQAMERFFLLYVQVSPCFKRRFSKIYAQNYQKVSKEASELSSLSVQLFTIPEVALDLLDDRILESVVESIQRLQNSLIQTKDGVKVIKPIGRSGNHDWDQYFRSLGDLNYLLYHGPLCEYVLRTETLQKQIVELLVGLWRLRKQKREERAHVLYEVHSTECTQFTCRLLTLPDLSGYGELTALDASENYLGSVARLAFHLPRLQCLRLQRNRLRRIERLGDLLHLQFLDVSENLLGPSPGAALQMIGNCRSETFRIAIQLESPAIAKERGDYRYQLLDLCPSLRIVDGEEPVEPRGALMDRGSAPVLQPRRQMRSSASMPQLKAVANPRLVLWEIELGSHLDQCGPGFFMETELLKNLTHLADFCRRPDVTLEELRSWYRALSNGLQRCEGFQSNFNCSAASSFHMPLLRLFSSCMNWDLLQDASLADEWREIIPLDVPVNALCHAVRALRFEAEIQTGWWVRNGQSMHQQQAEYRRRLRQWDLMTVQACMLLLNFHEAKEAEPLFCLWSAAFDETAPKDTLQVPVLERWRRLWSDELTVQIQLRFRLFWTLLVQAVNEMLPIEVTLCRRKWESRYARCSVILQRFLIQVLAKPISVSQLSALIPKELQVRETQLSEALDHVATRTDRNFQLKQRSWSFFDCCMAEAMPTRESRELQHDAEEAALQQQVLDLQVMEILGPDPTRSVFQHFFGVLYRHDPFGICRRECVMLGLKPFRWLKPAAWALLGLPLARCTCPTPGKDDFYACQTEPGGDVALGGYVEPLPLEPAGSAACSSNGGCAALGLTAGDCCPATNGQYLSCCDSKRRLETTNSSRRLTAYAMHKKGVTVDDTTLRWWLVGRMAGTKCALHEYLKLGRIWRRLPWDLSGSSRPGLRNGQRKAPRFSDTQIGNKKGVVESCSLKLCKLTEPLSFLFRLVPFRVPLRCGYFRMVSTGSRIYMLAGNGKQGPLRDVVARQKLESYIQSYGDFEGLWMPLKEKDLRPFGFVTIKDSVAAQQFVETSPHQVPDASVEIIARWEHRQENHMNRKSSLPGILQPLEIDDPNVSLKNYFAPPQTKKSLIRILRSPDEAYQQKRAARIRNVRGRDVPTKNTQLHLFHGPPGTGKTMAMKVLAAEAGLKFRSFIMNLGEPGYGTLQEMQDALKAIDEMSSGPNAVAVAVFIDEAEQVFSSRRSMQDYHSVRVESKNDIVKAFLEWTEGLQSRPRDAKPIIVVMATNLRNSIDEAIQSRVGETIRFSRPTIAQCKQHFAANAPNVRGWHWLLAILSSRVFFMDFRELEAVHNLVCEPDVAETEHVRSDEVTALNYFSAIWSVLQSRELLTGWREIDILKLITWQLPYLTYHLRVVRREMGDGMLDLRWLHQKLVQLLRAAMQTLRARL